MAIVYPSTPIRPNTHLYSHSNVYWRPAASPGASPRPYPTEAVIQRMTDPDYWYANPSPLPASSKKREPVNVVFETKEDRAPSLMDWVKRVAAVSLLAGGGLFIWRMLNNEHDHGTAPLADNSYTLNI